MGAALALSRVPREVLFKLKVHLNPWGLIKVQILTVKDLIFCISDKLPNGACAACCGSHTLSRKALWGQGRSAGTLSSRVMGV